MEHNYNKSYSLKELAVCYSPDVTPVTASRRLKYWINNSPKLTHELSIYGWTNNIRIYTPKQVALIIKWLGEP